jgi:kinesin family protein C2/C3
MEIEQLQLMKDNAKPPNLFIDKPSKFNSNQASLVTLNQRITLSDHLSYAEVNADAGHTSPIGIAPMRLDEADYEENVSGDEMTMYSIASIRIINCFPSFYI